MDINQISAAFVIDTSAPTLPDPDAAYCAAKGIEPRPTPADFYVPPTLSVRQGDLRTPILLLSAPAAVGKTSLARELQRRLQNRQRHTLYVPLHKSEIGDNFFSGLLANLFPTKPIADVLRALQSGRLVLLFDGYDEVALSNGQLNRNLAFSREVARSLSGEAVRCAAPAVVFLFRTVFQHAGVFAPIDHMATQLDVNFFDLPGRRAYLKAYLLKNSDQGRDLSSLADDFLDAFEKQMAPAQAEASAFFGHAIVLSAFGDFLLDSDVSNAKALVNKLAKSQVDDEFVNSVLEVVISTILAREKEKFPKASYAPELPNFEGFPPLVQSSLIRCVARTHNDKVSAESALMSAIEEQAQATLQDHPGFISLSPEQQRSLHDRYTEELQLRIKHHPFLDVASAGGDLVFRNPLYQDYFLAQAITRRDISMSDALKAHPQASHFMALFVLSALPGRDFSRLRGDALYQTFSLLNAAASDDDFRLELYYENGRWTGKFEGRDFAVASVQVSDSLLVFEVPNEAVIQNIDVAAGCGSGAMLLIQGPQGARAAESSVRLRTSSLRAEIVELDACKVTFDSCEIECNELRFLDRLIDLEGASSLSLNPCDGFRLNASDYATKRWSKQIEQRTLTFAADGRSVLSLLESVLLWFRKHKRGSYGVYDKRFDTVVLRKGRNPKMERFVDMLFHEKILRRNVELIELNQKTLDSFGVYYVQQNALECRDMAKLDPLVEKWRKRLDD